MSLELLRTYLPLAAIAAGVAALLWGQRDRLAGWLARLRPVPKSEPA